jgi:hypothetical protein
MENMQSVTTWKKKASKPYTHEDGHVGRNM